MFCWYIVYIYVLVDPHSPWETKGEIPSYSKSAQISLSKHLHEEWHSFAGRVASPQCVGLSLPSWATPASRWPRSDAVLRKWAWAVTSPSAVSMVKSCESFAPRDFSHNSAMPSSMDTLRRMGWMGGSVNEPEASAKHDIESRRKLTSGPKSQPSSSLSLKISCHASTKEMALRPLQSTSLSSSSSEKQILDSPPVHFCATLAPERISHSIESSAPLHLLTGPKTVLSIYVTSTVFPHTERELQSNPFRLSFFKSFSG